MNRHAVNSCAFFLLAVCARPTVAAQGAELADPYIEGVYAYFAGQAYQAEDYLSRAIAVDPDDPRPFYFRALSRNRQGRCYEANEDMQIGAALEARSQNRFDIGKTLERIQGPARLQLEEYRRNARISAGASPRLGPLKRSDAPVLRERRVVPLDEFSNPGVPRSFAAPTATPPQMEAAPPRTFEPAPNAAPAAGNPFSDDATNAPPAKAPANVPPVPPPRSNPIIPPQPEAAPPAEKPADKKADENPFL